MLDATIISAPTNNNTNYNGQLDFMTPHAERAVANAAVAEPCSRTRRRCAPEDACYVEAAGWQAY